MIMSKNLEKNIMKKNHPEVVDHILEPMVSGS